MLVMRLHIGIDSTITKDGLSSSITHVDHDHAHGASSNHTHGQHSSHDNGHSLGHVQGQDANDHAIYNPASDELTHASHVQDMVSDHAVVQQGTTYRQMTQSTS